MCWLSRCSAKGLRLLTLRASPQLSLEAIPAAVKIHIEELSLFAQGFLLSILPGWLLTFVSPYQVIAEAGAA